MSSKLHVQPPKIHSALQNIHLLQIPNESSPSSSHLWDGLFLQYLQNGLQELCKKKYLRFSFYCI